MPSASDIILSEAHPNMMVGSAYRQPEGTMIAEAFQGLYDFGGKHILHPSKK
jgi:hypothetical protein